METNVKILSTISAKLQERWDLTNSPNYNKSEEELVEENNALRQDIKYSMDMIDTIIDIETKNTGGSVVLG